MNASVTDSACASDRFRLAPVVGDDRLRQPGADVLLARRARRLQAIQAQARDDRRQIGLGGSEIRRARADEKRSHASCSTSSASVALPSIRYATANSAGRWV